MRQFLTGLLSVGGEAGDTSVGRPALHSAWWLPWMNAFSRWKTAKVVRKYQPWPLAPMSAGGQSDSSVFVPPGSASQVPLTSSFKDVVAGSSASAWKIG